MCVFCIFCGNFVSLRCIALLWKCVMRLMWKYVEGNVWPKLFDLPPPQLCNKYNFVIFYLPCIAWYIQWISFTLSSCVKAWISWSLPWSSNSCLALSSSSPASASKRRADKLNCEVAATLYWELPPYWNIWWNRKFIEKNTKIKSFAMLLNKAET